MTSGFIKYRQSINNINIDEVEKKIAKIANVDEHKDNFIKVSHNMFYNNFIDYKEIQDKFDYLITIHQYHDLISDSSNDVPLQIDSPKLAMVIMDKVNNFTTLKDKLENLAKNEDYKLFKEYYTEAYSTVVGWYMDFHNFFKFPQISSACYEDQKNNIFAHSDMTLTNIICTEDDKFILIDPDSFCWHTELELVFNYNKTLQRLSQVGFGSFA